MIIINGVSVRSCFPDDLLKNFLSLGMITSFMLTKGLSLENDFAMDKFKDIFKARSKTGVPPITIVRAEDLPDQNAVVVLDSEGFRSRNYLLNEFLEYWMLDLHRKANKHTLEQTLNVAIARTKKLDKDFEAMYVEVRKDIVRARRGVTSHHWKRSSKYWKNSYWRVETKKRHSKVPKLKKTSCERSQGLFLHAEEKWSDKAEEMEAMNLKIHLKNLLHSLMATTT